MTRCCRRSGEGSAYECPAFAFPVSLVGYGAYAVWVTANPPPRMRPCRAHWSESRIDLEWQMRHRAIEILDESRKAGAE